ncbi:MAG TPA: hypothetical protein DDY88_04825 [Actinobacteria bacterium]|nr:hypothetical protein [Actinomycetota bacterium]
MGEVKMSGSEPAVAPPIEPGYFHRLGLAARMEDAYVPWLQRVLGAVPIDSGMRQVQGIPFGHVGESASNESGAATSEMLWLGALPICIFAADDEVGPLGHFVARNGPGLHSVAWTVNDIWKTESLLRRAELRVTGVDIAGRHFFIHPADTAGLLIEITDTEFTHDPRDDASFLPPRPTDSVVQGADLAWMTVAVADPAKSAEILTNLIVSTVVEGLPRAAGEEVIDLRMHDVVIRLAKRPADDVRRDQFDSFCLSVPDLADSCRRLEADGISVASQEGELAWTEQADTLGMKIQWVQASALPKP